MNAKLSQFLLKFTTFSMLWTLVFGSSAVPLNAAEFLLMKDTLSRLKVSTLANHEVIMKWNTAVAASVTTTLNFPSAFTMGSVTSTDIDLSFATSTGGGLQNQCDHDTVTSSPQYTYLTVTSTGPTATAWNATVSGQNIRLQAPTSVVNGAAASQCFRIRIGTNVTSSVAAGSGTNQITNPSTATTYTVSTTQSTGDSGNFAIGIVSDDAVSTTASVDPQITFIVGATGTACTQTSAAPTSGGLLGIGTVSTTDIIGAGYICTRLSTNASLGAVVQIRSVNGQLKSTRTAADTIPSTAQTGVPGSINPSAASSTYGVCVHSDAASSTSGQPPARVSPFNPSSCLVTPAKSPTFGQLSTSFATAWRVTSTTENAFANFIVKAGATTTTPAHNDYNDTLFVIATATF